MNAKEQIVKIKKRVKILHFIVILLLIINAIIWFSTLFRHYNNNFVLFTVGLSCVAFLIAVTIVGIFVERRIKKSLKVFVEQLAGEVSDEDKKIAGELLKRWKKHYIASIKWVLNEFRKEKYPFGQQIIEDLIQIKKGIKVEERPFYSLLQNETFGEIGNQLLCEIFQIFKSNSYILDEELR